MPFCKIIDRNILLSFNPTVNIWLFNEGSIISEKWRSRNELLWQKFAAEIIVISISVSFYARQKWIMISRRAYKLYDIVKCTNARERVRMNVYTRHKASAASDTVNSARNLPINCFKWITSAGLSENSTRRY